MFAVGHMAVAYLLGKASSKILHTHINIPLLLVLSILPDVDIIYDFLMGTEIHRGPTHSIFLIAVIFIPIFIIYGKKAFPYFLALLSHPLICDFFIGGQLLLFWPLSTAEFGFHELGFINIDILSPINICVEIILFISAMALLYKTNDWKVFFTAKKTNLILIIPIITVLLPSTIGYPFDDSLLFTQPTLAIAHMIYLVLFSFAVVYSLIFYHKKYFVSSKKECNNTDKCKET